MRSERKETSLERRLRELQNESSSLQKDIKSLSRSLRKMGADTETLPAPAPVPDPPRSRLNPNYAASIGADTTTSVTVTNQDPLPGGSETEVNLFSTSPDPASPPEPAAAPATVLSTRSDTATPALRYRRMATPPRHDDHRFSRYFSSGSFSRSTPLGQEKRIQRNKAIFAVLCLLVFGYVLSRAFL